MTSACDMSLQVTSDPRMLAAVRGAVRCYVDTFGFSEDRTEEVVLAVDEACTNAIRHSFGGDPGRVYKLSLKSTPKWVTIELLDGGRPAPRAAMRKRGASNSGKDLSPGGVGVQLIHKVFDKVAFSPGRTRGNCVTMKLRRP